MEDIYIWNALTDLSAVQAYHFWIDFYYTDPDSRRQLSIDQKAEKLFISRSKFYEQRNEIFEDLNLPGIRDVTDSYILTIKEMVGTDEPELLLDPPRLIQWPPAKKEVPEDVVPEINQLLMGAQAASSSEQALDEDDESDEQEEETGNGEDETGGGFLQRIRQERISTLILGFFGLIAVAALLVWAASILPGLFRDEVAPLVGIESPTPVPSATNTRTPGPTPNETGTAAAVQAVIAEGLTRTREAQPTPDSGATAVAGIVATQSQEASFFTATPTPIPTNTPAPTDTPTPTDTPSPTPTSTPWVELVENFDGLLDRELWDVVGDYDISQGSVSPAGSVYLSIGEDEWKNYVVEIFVVDSDGCGNLTSPMCYIAVRQNGDDRVAFAFSRYGDAIFWVKDGGDWRDIDRTYYNGSIAGQTITIRVVDETITVQVGTDTPIELITDIPSGKVGFQLSGSSTFQTAVGPIRISPIP